MKHEALEELHFSMVSVYCDTASFCSFLRIVFLEIFFFFFFFFMA